MADELKAALKKYSWVLIFLAGLSGGSYLTLITFAAAWVEMNSRPIDVVNAADLVTIQHEMISDNQDEIDDLWAFICSKYPQECK